jgi:hypothetical protein
LKKSKQKENAPLLFNLAEIQNQCTKRFKIKPDETLEIIQNLYEKKLVTYPRTDARVLSTAVAKEISKNLNGIARGFKDEEVQGYIKKMVEEKVINAISAECVKKSANNREAFVFNKTCNVKISGYGACHELKNEKRSHKIGHHRSFKRKGQPEKRAEKKIERIGTDEVYSKVGVPIPTDLSACNKFVGMHIKRNLLAVIISVICKNSAVAVNNKPDRYNSADCGKKQKPQEMVFIIFFDFVKHISSSTLLFIIKFVININFQYTVYIFLQYF